MDLVRRSVAVLVAALSISIVFLAIPMSVGAPRASGTIVTSPGDAAAPRLAGFDPAILDFAQGPYEMPSYWSKMTPSVQDAARSPESPIRVFILTDDVNALGAFLRSSGVATRFGSEPTTRDGIRVVTAEVSSRILEKIAAQDFVHVVAPAVSPELPVATDPDLPAAINDGSPGPNLVDAGKGHHVPEAWALGYTGTGVRISPMDSGTDFGHPDLQGTYAVNADLTSPYFAWPMAFDPTSMELYLLFDITFPANPWSWYLDTAFATTADPLSGLIDTPFNGIVYDVSGIPSASGEYRIGLHPDQTLLAIYGRSVAVLVVDSTIPGLYDTVYVDLDDDTWFGDDKPVTRDSPDSWADYYDPSTGTWDYTDYTSGDGIADMSGGLAYFLADGFNPVPYSDVLAGIYGLPLPIPGAGDLVAFQIGDVFVPAGDHGTLVASSIVGQNVTGLVHGFAPDARILSVGNVYTSAFFFLDIFPFVGEGYDGLPGTGDEAHIASASFGYSGIFNDGWDFVARWVEYWSYIYADTTFVASTGNGGHGFGTVTTPGSSSNVIGVGASTSYSAFGGAFELAEHSTFGDVQPWSNRGPTALGQTKPDVVTIGAWATGDGALNSFVGDTPVFVWGGTSLSAPATAGILALVAQAWMDAEGLNFLPNYLARVILADSADNIHYDPQVMGHGITNAFRAVQAAASLDGLFAWNADGLVPSPTLVAGAYRGDVFTSFARLVSPGSTSSSTFTLESRSPTDKPVTIADWELRRTGRDTFFVNATNAAESPLDFLRPDYLIDLTGVVPVTTDLLKVTVHHPMSQLDPNGDLVRDSRWRVLVYDWLDYDGNGSVWNDRNGNGVVNAGEMDSLAGTEIMRFTYGYPSHTVLQAYVHRPLDRIHDGLLLGIQHRTRSAAVPFTNLTVTLDYFQAVEADWLSTDLSAVTIPAGGTVDLGVTVDLPADQPLGSLSASITISDGTAETQIPVVVNVAATGPAFSFGGDASSDRFLDTSRIQGGIDWDWRPEAGDWRFFFTDIPDETPIAPGESLLVHTWWERAPTDIDTIVFGPTPDAFSDIDSGVWGPYTLSRIASSPSTLVSAGRWRFQTATGGAEEWVAAPLSTGLHEIALHNVMYAGGSPTEVFTGEVGVFGATPTLWELETADGTGAGMFNVTSSLSLPGLDVQAYGISEPSFDPAVPIVDQGDYFEEFTVSNSGLVDIITDGPLGMDIDLYLYRWTGTIYQLIASSAGPTSFEQIRLERPADGLYLIDVFGFFVPGGAAEFSLFRVSVEGLELTPTDVPVGGIPSGAEVHFNVTWDIEIGTTPGVYLGIVYVGPEAAPVVAIPSIFVLTDEKAPMILTRSPGDGDSTNVNSPTIVVTYEDPRISANIVDVEFLLDGFDLTEMGTWDQTRFTWSFPFALGDGIHAATFTAYDGAGLWASTEWSFTIDTAAPSLSVTSPDYGLTRSATATVAGRTDSGATVTINGAAATVAPDGSFSGSAALSEGANTITVVARDAAGNAATVTRSVTRDTVAPALTVTSPVADERVLTNVVHVTGTTEPAAVVFVSGVHAAVSGTGSWSADIVLEFGSRTFTVVATDAAGNTASVTRTIVVGPAPDTTAPAVTVTSPSDNAATDQASILVTGTVDDPMATVIVNGVQVRPASNGDWSVTVSLAPGANTITVSAVDAAGNQGTAVTRTVTFSSPVPGINQAVQSLGGNFLLGIVIVLVALAALVFALYGNLNRKIEQLRRPKPPEGGEP